MYIAITLYLMQSLCVREYYALHSSVVVLYSFSALLFYAVCCFMAAVYGVASGSHSVPSVLLFPSDEKKTPKRLQTVRLPPQVFKLSHLSRLSLLVEVSLLVSKTIILMILSIPKLLSY